MKVQSDAHFGPILTVPNIEVSSAFPRRWSCALVSSDLPATMRPGEKRTANIVVTNNGTMTWQPTQTCFYSRDGALGLAPLNFNRWGGPSTCIRLATPVAPGGQYTFQIPLTAPTTLGPNTIIRQLHDQGASGVGIIDSTQGCLSQTIDISNAAPKPPGNDAVVVSHNFPTEMSPGERLNVRVTMRNTGLSDGTINADWDTTQPILYRGSAIWGWTSKAVTPVVPACANGPCGPANEANFDFVIVAPAATPAAAFSARMRTGGVPFGETFTAPPINVSTANPRRWSCGLISSDIPAIMAPGASRTANVVVVNNGTATWAPTRTCFYSVDGTIGSLPLNINKWGPGSTCVYLTTPVGPGQEHTFTFPIRAPTTLGQHAIVRQMADNRPLGPDGGIGLFDKTVGCLDQTVTVAVPFLDAEVTSHTIPFVAIRTDLVPVTVTMRNTGTIPWVGSDFALTSVNTPVDHWGVTSIPLGPNETVLPGESKEFQFLLVVPDTRRAQPSRWRMAQVGVGPFGEMLDHSTYVTTNMAFGERGFVLGGSPGFAGGTGDTFLAVTSSLDWSATAVGYAVSPTGSRVGLIARYGRLGRPDPSFGNGGFVTIDFGAAAGTNHQLEAVKIDAQGRILVAGRTEEGAGTTHAVLARFLADGSLDTSFGDADGVNRTGWVIGPGDAQPSRGFFTLFYPYPFPQLEEWWGTIHLDSSDRIVVTGTSWRLYSTTGLPIAHGSVLIARFTDDGALDPTYGDNAGFNYGRPQTFPIIDSFVEIVVGSVMMNDVLTLAANSELALNNNQPYGFLVRYDANGAIDTTFQGTFATVPGTVLFPGNRLADLAYEPSFNPSTILVAGDSDGPSPSNIVWRVNPTGTFGNYLVLSWSPLSAFQSLTKLSVGPDWIDVLGYSDEQGLGGGAIDQGLMMGIGPGPSVVSNYNWTNDPSGWFISTGTNGVSELSSGYDDAFFGGCPATTDPYAGAYRYVVGTSGGQALILRYSYLNQLDGYNIGPPFGPIN